MASVVASAAHAAHNAAASLLSANQVKPGSSIPTAKVKEEDPVKSTGLTLRGKNVIVGVPGAFTNTCNEHIPGYIQTLDEFRKRGIEDIYVLAVNDAFVVKAWKAQLAPNGTQVRFIADDQGLLVSALGLIFDATDVLGGPRSKRFVIVAQDDTIESLAVEEDPSKVTVTDAQTILKFL